MQANPPVFDCSQFNILLEYCDGDDLAMVEQIVRQFQEDLLPLLDRLERGVENHDFQAIAAAAHTLKGSGATFGLAQVEARALSLQTAAREQNYADVLRDRDAVASALRVGLPALDAHLRVLLGRSQ